MTPSELLALLFKCSAKTTTIVLACPALAPPAGELPLDPDAPTLWSISLGILVACCVLVTVCVALRTFTRIRIVKKLFTLEDGEYQQHYKHMHDANTDSALVIASVVNFTLLQFVNSTLTKQILFIPIVGLRLKAYGYGGSKHQWNVTVGNLFKALHVRLNLRYTHVTEL